MTVLQSMRPSCSFAVYSARPLDSKPEAKCNLGFRVFWLSQQKARVLKHNSHGSRLKGPYIQR